MKATVEKQDELHRTLNIELPWDMVSEEIDRAYRELAAKVSIKGFRKGKVPQSVLRQRFGRQVREDVLDKLIQDSYEAALIQHQVQPVTKPDLERGEFKEGQPFAYTVRVEVQPEIELKQIKGFELAKPAVNLTDEAVDAELENLRQGRAVLVPVEDRQDARHGDVVVIDYVAGQDGQPLAHGERKDHQLELGSASTVPGFEDQLIGLQTGASREFELDFPEQGVDADLAGKRIQFKVDLKALKRKEIPKLDDDFAKDLGEEGVNTLADLRNQVVERLRRGLEQQAEREIRDALVDRLIEANPFPVPPSVIARQKQAMIKEMEVLLSMQGFTPEQIAANQSEFITQDLDARAERTVRAAMLLATVGEKEKIVVTEEHIDAHLADLAARTGQNPARIKALYADPERRAQLLYDLRREKVLDYLMGLSNMNTEEHKEASTAESGAAEESPPAVGDEQ